MRLLYVEDDRINAMLFEATMQMQPDFELQVAEDAHQALDLALLWQPEVLIIDAHLPDMDGFELLRAMRQVPGLSGTPAFMCSADDQPEDVSRAKNAGFAGYWAKPINIARIMTDLEALRNAGRPSYPAC